MILERPKTLGAVSGLILAGLAIPALAATDRHDAVVNQANSPVVDSQGDCVRTRWDNATDVCAPAPAPQKVVERVVKPVVTPARQLKITERSIYFDFDKSALTADAEAKLNKVSEALKGSTDVRKAHIVGYADRIGNSDYNIKLSERRAKAVQNYMTEKGYLNTQVAKVRGLGESNSVTDCSGKQAFNKLVNCLQPDRRVEVEVEFIEDIRAQAPTTSPRNYQ